MHLQPPAGGALGALQGAGIHCTDGFLSDFTAFVLALHRASGQRCALMEMIVGFNSLCLDVCCSVHHLPSLDVIDRVKLINIFAPQQTRVKRRQ